MSRNGEIKESKLYLSNLTNTLLDKFRQELSSKVNYEVGMSEAIAFILEDYTKSYYGRLVDRDFINKESE